MKLLNIALGTIAGAAAGFAAGIILAPRSGAESRAMASDVLNDAWDSAVDTYERGSQAINDRIAGVRPDVDATTDELRAKVDLARERMDQLRDSLSSAVAPEEVEVAEAADESVEEAEVEVEAVEEAAEEEAAEDEAIDEEDAE